MVKKIKIIFVPIFVTAFLTSVLFSYAQEQVTLTTYYPAPFGVYANLTVTDQLKIENVNTNGYVSGVGPGIWLAPPKVGSGQPIQIASYATGGVYGLRLIYYGSGAADEAVVFAHYVTGAPDAVRGMWVMGNGAAVFTHDLTIFRDAQVNRNFGVNGDLSVNTGLSHLRDIRLNKDSGLTTDPFNGVFPYFPTMSYRNKSHL